MLITVLDFTGLFFGIAGAILVGRKCRWGFISFIIASSAYASMGFTLGTMGLVMQSLIFIGIDIYYFWRWTKDERICNQVIKQHKKTLDALDGR